MVNTDPAPDAPVAGNQIQGGDGLPQDKPNDEPDQDTKVLRVQYPHGSFDASVEGLPVITSEGVRVNADQAKEILSKAKDAGVTISARKE